MTAAVLAALGCLVGAPLTVAAASSTGLNLFDFDFSWVPRSPRANDTVRFLAHQPHYVGDLWLPDQRFRWYKLLPRTGFRLLKVGPRYQASASSDYFQGLYKLRVQLVDDGDNATRRYVDVVKYVGVQSRVRALLLADGRSLRRSSDADVSLPVENLTCRFWGQPRLERLHFWAPPAAGCTGPQFAEHLQDRPYVD
uniref:PKD domain-containing protein n=1 Tax=Macrostomum lignano TaxID=282301 RepID=A0A1I8I4F4_9PLAT